MKKTVAVAFSLPQLVSERLGIFLSIGRAVRTGDPMSSLSGMNAVTISAAAEYDTLFGTAPNFNPSLGIVARYFLSPLSLPDAHDWHKQMTDLNSASLSLSTAIGSADKAWREAIAAMSIDPLLADQVSAANSSSYIAQLLVSDDEREKAKGKILSGQAEAIFGTLEKATKSVQHIVDDVFSQTRLLEALRDLGVSVQDPESAMTFEAAYSALHTAAKLNANYVPASVSDIKGAAFANYAMPFNGAAKATRAGALPRSVNYRTLKNQDWNDAPWMDSAAKALGLVSFDRTKIDETTKFFTAFMGFMSASSFIWDVERIAQLGAKFAEVSDSATTPGADTALKAYFNRLKLVHSLVSAKIYYLSQGPLMLARLLQECTNSGLALETFERWAPEYVQAHKPAEAWAALESVPVSPFCHELFAGWKRPGSVELSAELIPVIMTDHGATMGTMAEHNALTVALARFGKYFLPERTVRAYLTKGAEMLGGTPIAPAQFTIKLGAAPLVFTQHGKMQGATLASIDDFSYSTIVESGFNRFNSGAALTHSPLWTEGALNAPAFSYGSITPADQRGHRDAFVEEGRKGLRRETFLRNNVPAVFFASVIPVSISHALLRDSRLLQFGPSNALPYELPAAPTFIVGTERVKTELISKRLLGTHEIPNDRFTSHAVNHQFGTNSDLAEEEDLNMLASILGVSARTLAANVEAQGIASRFLTKTAEGFKLHSPAVTQDPYFMAAASGFFYLPTSYVRSMHVCAVTDLVVEGAGYAGDPLPGTGKAKKTLQGREEQSQLVRQSSIGTIDVTVGWFPLSYYGTYAGTPGALPVSLTGEIVDFTTKLGYKLGSAEINLLKAWK